VVEEVVEIALFLHYSHRQRFKSLIYKNICTEIKTQIGRDFERKKRR
jgi:hypothetical protein